MKNNTQHHFPLAELLKALDVTLDDLRGNCHRRDLVDARCIVAVMIKEQDGVLQQDVAQVLNRTQGSISKMISRHYALLQWDASYKDKYENLKNSLSTL